MGRVMGNANLLKGRASYQSTR